MKLNEIKSNIPERGVYVGLRVLDPGTKLIREYIDQNNIPHKSNPKEHRKHVTLIYSRMWANIISESDMIYTASPIKFEVFPTRDGKRALVLLLSAPSVVARHRVLMSEHPLTYDFPQYKVHVTFSYDIGDFDESTLPPFAADLKLGEEYVEDLHLDWQNKK